MPPGKIGIEKLTTPRRASVTVSALQSRSTVPRRTASKRSPAVTGTHRTFSAGVALRTAAAMRSQSATAYPVGCPESSR